MVPLDTNISKQNMQPRYLASGACKYPYLAYPSPLHAWSSKSFIPSGLAMTLFPIALSLQRTSSLGYFILAERHKRAHLFRFLSILISCLSFALSTGLYHKHCPALLYLSSDRGILSGPLNILPLEIFMIKVQALYCTCIACFVLIYECTTFVSIAYAGALDIGLQDQ